MGERLSCRNSAGMPGLAAFKSRINIPGLKMWVQDCNPYSCQTLGQSRDCSTKFRSFDSPEWPAQPVAVIHPILHDVCSMYIVYTFSAECETAIAPCLGSHCRTNICKIQGLNCCQCKSLVNISSIEVCACCPKVSVITAIRWWSM